MECTSNSSTGLRPIFIIFKILALYPLSNHIFNTIFAFASISVGAWMIISLLVISPVYVNGSMRVFMSYVVFIIRAILPMLIITQAFFTRLEQTKIFEILDEIDRTFTRNFSKNINYKRLQIKYLVSFFAPLLFLAAIRVFFVFHLIIFHADAKFRFYWFHQVQSLIVSRIRCLQAAFYANLINDRIRWIHLELEIIGQRRNMSEQKLQARIIFLRQIYAMIYDVNALINKSFGWSLLVIAMSYFVDSVGNCFKYILVIEGILPISDNISSSVGLVSTSITLITLCYACGRCADNAAETYGLIGKLIGRTTNGRLKKFNNELQEILLQVHHQNIVITAHDFVTADMNLLASIIFATATYIIVIIQS